MVDNFCSLVLKYPASSWRSKPHVKCDISWLWIFFVFLEKNLSVEKQKFAHFSMKVHMPLLHIETVMVCSKINQFMYNSVLLCINTWQPHKVCKNANDLSWCHIHVNGSVQLDIICMVYGYILYINWVNLLEKSDWENDQYLLKLIWCVMLCRRAFYWSLKT